MLNCASCGAEVERKWRHCAACGVPVPRRLRFDGRNPLGLLALAVVVLNLGALAMLGAERRLGQRTDDLSDTREALRDSRTLVVSLRTELAARVKERDDLRADLEKTRGNLSDAQRSVETQGRQLETLKDCLTAIEDIGVAIDEGDEKAALEAVDRANEACSKAEAFL
jgi:septal ring factor EnvC (AmiA/AmiB activator)